jgi:hypothetical protein
MNRALIILVPLFFGFLTAFVASRRGYRPSVWFFLGVLLGAFATAAVLVQPRARKEVSDAPRPVSDSALRH